ncbi:MAG: class F sortase [Aeromicrobium sp.]
MTRRRRVLAAICAIIAVALAAAWLLWSNPEPSRSQAWPLVTLPTIAGPTAKPNVCEQEPSSEPFTPTRIDIDHIQARIPVIALGRDGNNVPSVPPISNVGKAEFAWDKPPGLMPGSPKGNVLLNAHTWPDGSALGNRLLAKLKVNDKIAVRGDSTHLCYRVTEKIEVVASNGFPAYYEREGDPQLAIIVCSGTRLGPGHWTKRTIWFAAPITA